MVNEWRRTSLGHLVSLQRGHDLTEEERRLGDVPVMGSAGQNGHHDTALVKGPGIVIGRSGASFGQVHFSVADYWPHNTALYVTDFRGNNPQFVYYLLKTIDFARYNSGSAQPSLNRNYIYPIEIDIPPIEEQRAIAHVLCTLDDKIELNRRRNETLEAMARALFKSWFVDFDDVAPEEMQESEWGLIPKGWTVRPLDEIADFLNGLAMQKYSATNLEGSLPVIKIAELRNGVSAKSDRASRAVPEDYLVKNGDFLFSWSGSLMAKFWTGGEGALNQHLFKVTSDQYPMWLVSQWVHHHLEEFQSIAASKATTMGHIQRGHLKAAMTVCPPNDSLKKMGVAMAPLVEQSIQNELESCSLTRVRETLLPKLISGEIKMNRAETE